MESSNSSIPVEAATLAATELPSLMRPDLWPVLIVEEAHASPQPETWAHICVSDTSKAIIRKADRYAGSSNPVMILGECGTGKTQLANYIHAVSDKRSHPVINVACGKLGSDLSSGVRENRWLALLQKYGHDPNVTWLLEGIDEIPDSIQYLVCRFVDQILQSGVRRTHPFVLSTASAEFSRALESGEFRKDLFYRLDVLQLQIPPLRENKADIPPLVSHFLSRLSFREDEPMQFTPDAVEVLSEYHWPGNIVELRNVIARVSVLSDRRIIDADQLLLHWQMPNRQMADNMPCGNTTNLNLEEAETQLILKAVERCAGNKTAAAKKLGISTRTLQNKMHKYRQLGLVK